MTRLIRTLLALSALLAAMSVPVRAAEPVDLLLVLASDVSRSVDTRKFQLQREGYAAALSNPRVIEAINAAGAPVLAVDFTIGEARVRYHAPLRFDDEYDIKVRVGEIRHSSWAFEYAIDRADGAHCADASTIQVMLDRSTGRATRIPEGLRETLAAARGVAGEGPR